MTPNFIKQIVSDWMDLDELIDSCWGFYAHGFLPGLGWQIQNVGIEGEDLSLVVTNQSYDPALEVCFIPLDLLVAKDFEGLKQAGIRHRKEKDAKLEEERQERIKKAEEQREVDDRAEYQRLKEKYESV